MPLYLIPITSYSWLNIVYWTLLYEFIFYILIGILYKFVATGVLVFMLAAFVSVFCVLAFFGSPQVVIFLFFIGCCGFRFYIGRDSIFALSVAVCFGAAVIAVLGKPAMALVGLATLVGILFVTFPLGRMLSFLGAISYSLYLLHVPVSGRVINLGRRFGHGEWFDLSLSVAALIICLLAATAYWLWVESPFQRLSRRIRIKRAIAGADPNSSIIDPVVPKEYSR